LYSLGNLDDSFTEQSLRDDLSRYGHIDQVKIVRDKNIGFVHFLSIATAMKVVNELPKEPEWHGKRVNYGKDRCAYVPRNQHQQQQHNQMAAAMAQHTAAQLTPFNPLSPAPLSPSLSPMPFSGGFVDPNVQAGNRCIYCESRLRISLALMRDITDVWTRLSSAT
jgi:RNA recognition motif-containing protein